MIIPTDGGLRPGDAKWQPMVDWLTANHFNVNHVPVDALIEVRDGTCLGVEMFVHDNQGKLRLINGEVPRRTEWHPMTTPPPDVLLPTDGDPR